MKISYVFTCGRLESLFKILSLTQQGEEKVTSKDAKIIEQYRKDIALGRPFEETELYQVIEKSEEKIVVNRLSNILRDKPTQQNKFDLDEYKTGAWSEFNDYKLAVRFSNAKTELSEKHFAKTWGLAFVANTSGGFRKGRISFCWMLGNLVSRK